MSDFNSKHDTKASFSQQHMLKKGLLKFREAGEKAALKEAKQLHDRECFHTVNISEMTKEERRKAQEALKFLTEKRDGSTKGRTMCNGKPTREWLMKQDSASPAASLESLMLRSVTEMS